MVFSKKRILFISPSDIVKDSRILKKISVAKSAGFEVLALGIKYSNRNHKNSSKNIISFNLYSRILNVKKNILFKVAMEGNLRILTDLDESWIRHGINELLINRSRKKLLNQDLSPLSSDFQSEKLKAFPSRLSVD